MCVGGGGGGGDMYGGLVLFDMHNNTQVSSIIVVLQTEVSALTFRVNYARCFTTACIYTCMVVDIMYCVCVCSPTVMPR